jgi:3-hydroxyacyl-CoA dehydrogenase
MRAVGVIGAGQMGAGIAQVSAGAGYHVYLSDIDMEKAEAGKAGIGKALPVKRPTCCWHGSSRLPATSRWRTPD